MSIRSYRFVGTQSTDQAGVSVSSAGDVDGDGRDDVIIGAHLANGDAIFSGEAYLVTAAALASADAADGAVDGVIDLENINGLEGSYRFSGVDSSDSAGISVSSVGDVDGDGKDDLIIGASRADGGGRTSGEAYLVTASALSAADAADGTADGNVNLANVNEQTGSYQLVGTESRDGAGGAVSSAGDIDGDGKDDLLIGASDASDGGTFAGEAYVLTAASLTDADAADGTTDGIIDLDNVNEQTNSYQFVGTEELDRAGGTVSTAGDVDGDGKDDFLIGASGADGGGNRSGEVYLINASDLAAADAADGTTDGIIDLDNINEQTNSYQFIGTEANDRAGGVSSAGDVDGDGKDDLLISAHNASGGGRFSGEVYLVNASDLAAADAADGTTDGVIDLDNVNEQTGSYQFIGAEASDQAGVSISSAGDVDGDGKDDLIIGAFTADDNGFESGAAYLMTASGLAAADAADGTTDGVIDLDNVNEQTGSYQFIGSGPDDAAGRSVSSAGDVDGDGKDDLLIGAYFADGGGNDSGEAYLLTANTLIAADAADGTIDGIINLGNADIDI
ncbi:FG-GAP repeat protein, partial [Pseudovibrio denitrificans]